jgi:hypothetical protein
MQPLLTMLGNTTSLTINHEQEVTKRGFKNFSDYCVPCVPTVANNALNASANNQLTILYLGQVTFRTPSIQACAHTYTHTHTQTDAGDLALF